MKTVIFTILLAFVFLSCSKNTTNPTDTNGVQFTYMVEHNPANFYQIDVKTNLMDKFTETGVKNGTIIYINNVDWGKVVETGENYSLWIKDMARVEADSLTTVSFNLELQEPSLILEGKVYKKKHFVISYSRDSYNDVLATDASADLVAARFKMYAERCKKAGQIAAYINNTLVAKSPDPYTQVCSKILGLFLQALQSEQTQQRQQIEAVICGAECFGQLKEWLYELEQ